MPVHHLLVKAADYRRFFRVNGDFMWSWKSNRAGKELRCLPAHPSGQNKTYSKEALADTWRRNMTHPHQQGPCLSPVQPAHLYSSHSPERASCCANSGSHDSALNSLNSTFKSSQSFGNFWELLPGKPLETDVKLQNNLEILTFRRQGWKAHPD